MSLLALNRGPGGVCGRSQSMPWQSLTTIRRRWLVSAFGVCALFGGGNALFSHYGVDRLWGVTAACGYSAAAVAVLAWKSRGTDLALAVSFCGALVVPVVWMAWTGQAHPDVSVVERSASMLVHHGVL